MLDSVENIYKYLTEVYNRLLNDREANETMNCALKAHKRWNKDNIGTYNMGGTSVTHSTNNWFEFLMLCHNITAYPRDFAGRLGLDLNESIFGKKLALYLINETFP